VPVKRKRALVATNPPRDSRPELIADDEKSVILPARSSAQDRDRSAGGGWFRFGVGFEPYRTDRFRHALKTHVGAPA